MYTVFCAEPASAMLTVATAEVCVMLPMLTPDRLGSGSGGHRAVSELAEF